MSPASVDKSVALVVRRSGEHHELLVFDHPGAGTQIVKGTVEPGESPDDAVVRELFEESGVVVDNPGNRIGTWVYKHTGEHDAEEQTWHLFWMLAPTGLPERWNHAPVGSDEEFGLCFSFRWLPIDVQLEARLHPLFGPVAQRVLARASAETARR